MGSAANVARSDDSLDRRNGAASILGTSSSARRPTGRRWPASSHRSAINAAGIAIAPTSAGNKYLGLYAMS